MPAMNSGTACASRTGMRIGDWKSAPPGVMALLQSLQIQGADFEPLRRLGDGELDRLLLFTDRAHLTLLLSRLPSDILPGWTAERIQQNLSDNATRLGRIRAVYEEAASNFRKRGAEHLLLKGWAQYPGYVESPNLRMQSDIDVYCPPHSILGARDALRAIGYETVPTQKKIVADHFPPMARPTCWRWRGNPFDPDMPPTIELHFCLWNEHTSRIPIPEVELFWLRHVDREVEGFSFPGLDPADHLGYFALHILRGLFRGDWTVHHAHELAYFLHGHAGDREFWQRWQRLHSDSLRSLQAIAFRLASIWFGCELAAEVVNQEVHPAVEPWIRQFGFSPLEAMFEPRRDGVWLHTALLSSRKDRLWAIRRALLPTRVPLRRTSLYFSVNHIAVQPERSTVAAAYAAYILGRTRFFGALLRRECRVGLRWWFSLRRLRFRRTSPVQ